MKWLGKSSFLVFLIAVLTSACSPSQSPTPTNLPDTPAPTAAPTALPPTATPTPPPTVTLYFVSPAQIELISPEGVRVLIDVREPRSLSSPATADDLLITSQPGNDHMNMTLHESFEGQQLFTEEGELTAEGVIVRSIPSIHSQNDQPRPEGGTNYIIVVEIGGLRFVHFGDPAEDTFSPEQLEAIGEVDVAFMQFFNSYSQMNLDNMKGFNLMEQVNPRVIIPTHINLDTVKVTWDYWPPQFIKEPMITLSPETLPDEPSIIFMGDTVAAYEKAYNDR